MPISRSSQFSIKETVMPGIECLDFRSKCALTVGERWLDISASEQPLQKMHHAKKSRI